MKKKILSLLVACVMLMSCSVVVVMAASDNAGVPNADTLSATPDGSTGANEVNNGVEPLVAVSATPDGSTGANKVNNGDEPQIAVSIPVDVDSAPLDELGRATLYWNDTTINYDTRMRFISDYAGGYFDLDGVTATFTVEITNGNSENIQIDWCNEDGDVTVLYTGKTDSATVSYTSSGREKGNFRVWNKAVAAITVDASITY